MALIYLYGTIGQISIVCFYAAILRLNRIEYTGLIECIFLAIGGLSSAIWGIIISKRLNNTSFKDIFKDFFGFKQPIRYYLIAFLYLFIIFGQPVIGKITFLLGLLASCFILGSIYKLTNSLWLCVMYHALLNALSQTTQMISFNYTVITTLICIIISVFLVKNNTKTTECLIRIYNLWEHLRKLKNQLCYNRFKIKC